MGGQVAQALLITQHQTLTRFQAITRTVQVLLMQGLLFKTPLCRRQVGLIRRGSRQRRQILCKARCQACQTIVNIVLSPAFRCRLLDRQGHCRFQGCRDLVLGLLQALGMVLA